MVRLSTFSLVAGDPENGDLGIIVQSKFPAVGAIVPRAVAKVGAVASQAWAKASYDPRGLELKVFLAQQHVLNYQ
ncbi:MAG: DUF1028 domain-containing protein [Candidatus Thorarchaeota archaeon]|nr:DUF1028 domain-containing protein [Candidatus Thorarchaeota archaeon]